MKKLLKLLLSIFVIFALVGCKSKQEEPILNEQIQEQEVIKEETKKEEVIQETTPEKITSEDTKVISSDISNMYFWVVFYDQYDNELQREALKYGTVPEYKGWLPEGFDKWVYKKSGRDVGTLKSITGNTYFKAVCNNASHFSGGSSGSNPNPSPQINEYGFYYNAKYSGTSLNAYVIFTDSEISPGTKIAYLDIQLPPSLTESRTFPYSVTGNTITVAFGLPSVPTLVFTIDNENSLSISIPTMGSDNFTLSQHGIKSGITNTNFFYMGSSLLATIGLDSATSITIPSGFPTIGNNLLSNNTSLQSVSIPSSVQHIGDSVFYGCSSLTLINLPSSLQTIGEFAFQYAAITSISIPSSVSSIGQFAFSGCNSLNTVNFDSASNITTIKLRTFFESGIETITLPNNVSIIDDYAFTSCSDLTSATLPASVTSIGDSCFSGCTSLTSINFNGTIAQWNNISKGEFWNSSVPATYVQCNDGQASLS